MSTTVGIVTVGDELLSGDVENTNAAWIATQLTERGLDVREIRVIPDETAAIEATVSELGQAHTFVVMTGGLGSTPDDVTVRGVARALDQPLEANDTARELVEAAVAEIHEEYPEFQHDIDAASQYPSGARIIPNEVGISPGCVCGNVYVLPGIPDEMKAVFGEVTEDFSGDIASRSLYTETAESHLNRVLNEVAERFSVRVGCYPIDERKRVRLASEDTTALAEASEWLSDQPEFAAPVGEPDGASE
ncbi:MAG: competence/damage-inducible protein A [Halolamina sp.]